MRDIRHNGFEVFLKESKSSLISILHNQNDKNHLEITNIFCSFHTTYSRNNMCQKCEGILGLRVLNDFFFFLNILKI